MGFPNGLGQERQMDPTKLTRARAEKLVAQTEDEVALKALAAHKNKHVAHKATFKLARLAAAPLKSGGAS
jgi:hypothetical protein